MKTGTFRSVKAAKKQQIDRLGDDTEADETGDEVAELPITNAEKDAPGPDSKSPLNILISHPEIFDSILSFSDQQSLTQLLRCCKAVYKMIPRHLYTHITVTPDKYHRIFTEAATKRDFKSKRELLLNTRSIRVIHTNRISSELCPAKYRDHESVQGLMPNLRTLYWWVSERLPKLAFLSALDSLALKSISGIQLPAIHKHITLLPRYPNRYTYQDPAFPQDTVLAFNSSHIGTLTVLFPLQALWNKWAAPGREYWIDQISESCLYHLQTDGKTLRLVGFGLLQQVPWWSAFVPSNEHIVTPSASLDVQIAEWMDRFRRSNIVGDVQSTAKMIREKVQMMSFAEWMPEGSKLGVFTQLEQTRMLEVETKYLNDGRAADGRST